MPTKKEKEIRNIRFAILTLASYIQMIQSGDIQEYKVIEEINDLLNE